MGAAAVNRSRRRTQLVGERPEAAPGTFEFVKCSSAFIEFVSMVPESSRGAPVATTSRPSDGLGSPGQIASKRGLKVQDIIARRTDGSGNAEVA